MADQRLTRLWQVSQAIHQSLQQKKVIHTALHQLTKLFPKSSPYIYIANFPHRQLKPYYLNADFINFGATGPQDHAGVEEWVFATGQSTIMNNQPLILKAANQKQANQDLKVHCLALPLIIDNQVAGVIQLYRSGGFQPFSQDDLTILEHLALILGSALNNAKTMDRQTTFNRELEKEIKSTTEQLRKANHDLRQTEIVRSESISMVAHELRTPITSISGFTKLFLTGKLGDLTKEQLEFCHIIGKNTKFIEHLINDLLVLTKLELDKLELNFESINCANLIIETVNGMRGSIDNHISRIKIGLIPADLRVNGDKLRLIQVLTNLITNAIKYAPADTPVTIDCTAENGHIIFSVDDLGKPLSPEQQQKVFDKFFRVKSSSNKSGSGLGLAICQKIINKHQGRLWATANGDQGNSFRFQLQQIQAQGLADQTPSHSEKNNIQNSGQTATQSHQGIMHKNQNDRGYDTNQKGD